MPSPSVTFAGTTVAMVAFAANSLLCRRALGSDAIDAASFTLLRIASGAAALALICTVRSRDRRRTFAFDGISAAALFTYAAAFSFAYRHLTAGTGALILFGAVQLTMIGAGFAHGERPRTVEWMGFLIALGGLIWLVSPGLSAPSPVGSSLMALAGAAWGVYSLRGRRRGDPLTATAANFVWALPFALAVWLAVPERTVSAPGVLWAVLSGALASGAGYAIWYWALPGLTATRASMVQLTVPALAAFGGVVLLGEALTLRLVLSSLLVIGGIGLAIATHRKSR